MKCDETGCTFRWADVCCWGFVPVFGSNGAEFVQLHKDGTPEPTCLECGSPLTKAKAKPQ